MSGILYGIGVGAGSGSELTLKALEIIKNCDVIFLPNKAASDCRAYKIVKEVYPEIEKKELHFCDFPMSKDKNDLISVWENTAKEICEVLKEKPAVFLTIGDAAIYSTFFYLKNLVEKEGFSSKVISGIPSFCSVAAKLGMSLALESEQIHIIPDTENLTQAFSLLGTLIFMKSGKNLAKLKVFLIQNQAQITEFGAVSNCGFSDEKIVRTPRELDESQYLTVVIVKKKSELFSSSFFQNTACKYFPCHKNVPVKDFNCLFCYCPLYTLGKNCGGNFKYTEKGIKSCVDCNIPHNRENYDKIISKLRLS